MEFQENALVKVVGNSSILRGFEGSFGIITGKVFEGKWLVKFKETAVIGGRKYGGLSHTVEERDLELIAILDSPKK